MTEDEEFQRIAASEFGEHWQPPAPETPPAADFHLNLYDDDESYRRVEPTTWVTGPLARVGITLLVVAVIFVLVRVTAGPDWLGWISGAAGIAGLGFLIAQAVGHRPPDDGTAV